MRKNSLQQIIHNDQSLSHDIGRVALIPFESEGVHELPGAGLIIREANPQETVQDVTVGKLSSDGKELVLPSAHFIDLQNYLDDNIFDLDNNDEAGEFVF